MLISVIICTYNRAPILARVLSSIQTQSLSPELFELIVVDNNSTDSTKKVVEEYCEILPNLRYIFEPRQGLSHARNRGWQEAGGTYVGYLDDDAKAPAEWLQTAETIINEQSPEIFGGPYYAYYDSPTPVWWKDSYESHVQGNEPRELDESEHLVGGNIFFIKEILEKYEGFNEKFGMSGEKLGYGEESDLIDRLRKRDDRISVYYHPDLYIYHLVDAKKMNLVWVLKQRFLLGRHYSKWHNQQVGKSGKDHNLITVIKILAVLLRLMYRLLFASIFRSREEYHYFQNYLYECVYDQISTLGVLYGRVKLK